MDAHDRTVEEHVLELSILGQFGEGPLAHPTSLPAREPSVHAVPEAELLGQVTSRCPRAGDPRPGLDEPPIVGRSSPSVTGLTR